MKTFFSCGLRRKRSPSPPSKAKSVNKPKPKSSPNSMLTLQSSRGWIAVFRWLTATSTKTRNSFFPMLEIQRRKRKFCAWKIFEERQLFFIPPTVVIAMSHAVVADLLFVLLFFSRPFRRKRNPQRSWIFPLSSSRLVLRYHFFISSLR